MLLSNDPPTTEIYTLSLHDALPICKRMDPAAKPRYFCVRSTDTSSLSLRAKRSEEHTSELQSLAYLVCRLLLEKKNKSHTQTAEHTECQCARRAQRSSFR